MTEIKERGEVVRTAIIRSGLKMSVVAERLKVSRPTLNRRLNEPFLDYDFIRRVGTIIFHDFAEDFPEIQPAAPAPTPIAQPLLSYQPETIQECKDKLIQVYSLYTDLLHKYNSLLLSKS